MNDFKRSIWPIDGTMTSITTPGLSEPESNHNEGVLHIPGLEPHNEMQFSVIQFDQSESL